ncbi:unnamed protein product [Sphagnum balticum]
MKLMCCLPVHDRAEAHHGFLSGGLVCTRASVRDRKEWGKGMHAVFLGTLETCRRRNQGRSARQAGDAAGQLFLSPHPTLQAAADGAVLPLACGPQLPSPFFSGARVRPLSL